MGQIRDAAKWTLMTLEEKLLYLVTTFAEEERQGKVDHLGVSQPQRAWHGPFGNVAISC